MSRTPRTQEGCRALGGPPARPGMSPCTLHPERQPTHGEEPRPDAPDGAPVSNHMSSELIRRHTKWRAYLPARVVPKRTLLVVRIPARLLPVRLTLWYRRPRATLTAPHP